MQKVVTRGDADAWYEKTLRTSQQIPNWGEISPDGFQTVDMPRVRCTANEKRMEISCRPIGTHTSGIATRITLDRGAPDTPKPWSFRKRKLAAN
jgi:hypothetical protein